jgi:hypothetical protein
LFTGTDQIFIFAPNLGLTVGNDYVAFLSVSLLPGAPSGASLMRERIDNPYGSGSLVLFNNGYNFSALTTTTWDYTGDNVLDAAIVATFDSGPSASPVPETGSTLALLALSLFALVAVRPNSGSVYWITWRSIRNHCRLLCK